MSLEGRVLYIHGTVWQNKTGHFMLRKAREKSGRDQSSIIPFMYMILMAKEFPQVTLLKIINTSLFPSLSLSLCLSLSVYVCMNYVHMSVIVRDQSWVLFLRLSGQQVLGIHLSPPA